MGSVNRAYLRNLARLYANGRPGGADDFVPDTDSSLNGVSMDTLVNTAIVEWYDMLVAARGHEHFATDATLAILPNVAAYTLPENFYELLSARLEWSASDREELEPVPVRGRTELDMITVFQRGTPKAYRLRGSQAGGLRTFELFPAPSSGTVVNCTIRYIPLCSLLTDDVTTFDDANGTSDWVALSAAIKYRVAAEKPLGDLTALLQSATGRITALADQRNANVAEQVGQTYPERSRGRDWPERRGYWV